MVVWGLFRDQRAVIDFDMKRFGLVPKVAVGMNYSLLGCPVFQRFLDIQEVILPVHLHRHPGRPYDNRKNPYRHRDHRETVRR